MIDHLYIIPLTPRQWAEYRSYQRWNYQSEFWFRVLLWVAGLTLLLCCSMDTAFASVDRTQSKLADRYHRHQRELQAVTEEWIAYCKSQDKVLQMSSGEPWCVAPAPVPAPPAPKPSAPQ